ncbi:MAG: hypothetical protein ACKN9E_09600, partial [Microcystaceae cyanobacterium]
REILEKIFGLIPYFKSKDELLEEEFSRFVENYQPQAIEDIPAIKNYFKAYVTNGDVRRILETKNYTELATNAFFSTRDLKAVPEKYRSLVPIYVKDYITLERFTA